MPTSYSYNRPLARRDSTDLFDVAMSYTIVLMPLVAIVLRLGVGMSVRYFSTLLFFVGSLFILIRGYQKKSFNLPWYLLIYGLFVMYTVITNLLMTDMAAETGVLKYFYSNYLMTSLLGLFVAENLNLNITWLRRILKIMIGIILFAGITSIIQFFDPRFMVDTTNEEFLEISIEQYGERRWSIYSWTDYVDIGFSFLTYISVAFSIGLIFSKRSYWMVALGFLVSLLNGSRWVMLNAILISLQDFLSTNNRFSRFLKYSGYLVILLIFVYVFLLAIGVDINALIFDRIFEESAGTRLVALEVFLDQFPKNPIFGTGGVYTKETIKLIAGRSSQIHVGYLAIFYLYGIIGGVLFISFLISILRKLYSVAKLTGFWGAYYAFLGLALANVTLVTFGVYYHGLLIAIIFHKFFERNIPAFVGNMQEVVEEPERVPQYS